MLDEIQTHQNVLNEFKKISSWYQNDVEIYQWIRNRLIHGNNPSILDNSQPSS